MTVRSERRSLVLLALAFAAAVVVELLAPRPVDWQPDFTRGAAKPYGSRVLFDVLDDLFPGARVTAEPGPPYLALQDPSLGRVNYLFVADRFEPDPAEAEALLAFAARGGTVFVAAHVAGGALFDTLRVAVEGPMPVLALPGGGRDTLDAIRLVAPALAREGPFGLRAGTADRTFARFDTARATVLGVDDEARPNYVRLAWGEGAFYLSTVPLAFTNYHLLEGGNARYVAAALSYLPVQDVVWDEHHKPGRVEARTPLRYVLAQPALRAAYLLGLATLLLFVTFHARRRQRVQPVVARPQNTMLAFVETVGRLYYQRGDHANLAAKRAAHVLDHVRTRLRLPTGRLDDAFAAQVAERSGAPLDDVRAVVAGIERLQGRTYVSEEELLRFSEAIERFMAARRR